MGIGSISFWQQDQSFWNQNQSFSAQDQNYWSQAQAQSQASSADASLINSMGAAETNEAKGLASIANQTALSRVNSQISALVQQALQPSGSSTPSSSTGTGATTPSSGNSTNSSSTASSGAPAIATGTVPLTLGASLATLGILPGGTITVNDGTNTTTYRSTGSDTVADLVNAFNIDLPTNAQVTASLNALGKLVITGRNDAISVTIGGSGTDAAAIGFSVGNNTFQPTAPSASSSSASAAAASTTSSSSSSSTPSKSGSKVLPTSLALAEQAAGTASSILSAAGVSGSLVDMLV